LVEGTIGTTKEDCGRGDGVSLLHWDVIEILGNEESSAESEESEEKRMMSKLKGEGEGSRANPFESHGVDWIQKIITDQLVLRENFVSPKDEFENGEVEGDDEERLIIERQDDVREGSFRGERGQEIPRFVSRPRSMNQRSRLDSFPNWRRGERFD
jgi:hypothetical protein